MENRPFPVLCDRCQAEGLAGEAEFEGLAGLGDLLDFEPVPRRKRANGWDAQAQRAFIAALAVTGSDRQAAAIVGRNAFGVTQLCKSKDNEGFLAARAKAMEIFAGKERVRRSDGLLAAARGEAARARDRHRLPWSDSATRRLAPPEPVAEPEPPESLDPEADGSSGYIPADALEVICAIVQKYRLKLEAERRCRLEGRIAEADFYLRQITMLEVSLDVVSGNGMEALKQARLGRHGLLAIAETGWSALLDGARRRFWEAAGEPPRPEYPPRHLLEQHDGYATEPLTTSWGGRPESHEEQRRRFEEPYALDAEAQVEWEAEARRGYEQRRESDAAHGRRDGEGRPAWGSADRTDVTNSVRDGLEEARLDHEKRTPPGEADGDGPDPLAGEERES